MRIGTHPAGDTQQYLVGSGAVRAAAEVLGQALQTLKAARVCHIPMRDQSNALPGSKLTP